MVLNGGPYLKVILAEIVVKAGDSKLRAGSERNISDQLRNKKWGLALHTVRVRMGGCRHGGLDVHDRSALRDSIVRRYGTVIIPG
jgi:hypothetical protein